MNWKQRKPNCFSMENWRKDFMEFLSMEQAASTLVEDNRPDELCTFLKILSPGNMRIPMLWRTDILLYRMCIQASAVAYLSLDHLEICLEHPRNPKDNQELQNINSYQMNNNTLSFNWSKNLSFSLMYISTRFHFLALKPWFCIVLMIISKI